MIRRLFVALSPILLLLARALLAPMRRQRREASAAAPEYTVSIWGALSSTLEIDTLRANAD